MPDEPLIFTTRGNLPLSALTRKDRWEYLPGEYVKHVVVHLLDGEVVREEPSVCLLKTFAGEAISGAFNCEG